MRTAIHVAACLMCAACGPGSERGTKPGPSEGNMDGGVVSLVDGAADGAADGGSDIDATRCGDDRPCCPDGAVLILGSSDPDELAGGDEAECLLALAGDDEASGGGGDDVLVCGDGADDCAGGPGNDTLIGQAGDDLLRGGEGDDVLFGEAGDDRLLGGAGDDVLVGGEGDDQLEGGDDSDTLHPGPGRDTVQGGGGDDVIEIGSVCDLVAGETIDGGDGSDTLRAPTDAEGLAQRGVIVTSVERFELIAAVAGDCETRCPEGTHRVHVSGTRGLSALGSYDDRGDAQEEPPRESAADYRCVADATCEDLECGDHGQCVQVDGEATCECAEGYVGGECALCAPGYEQVRGLCVLGSSCGRDACSGRGECVQTRDGLACECEQGVGGPRCTHCAEGFHAQGAACVEDETCTRDSCSGHGTCAVRGGAITCACDRSYAGPRCELTCVGNDCNGRGTCAQLDGVPICRCQEGFDPLTDCASCETGFTPDTSGGPDTLRCALEPGCPADACSGHGTCATTPTGRVCTCDGGYSGSTCADCASGYVRVGARCVSAETCDADACSGHGTCDLRGRVGACTCARGYAGSDCAELNGPTQVLIRGAEQTLHDTTPIELQADVYGVGDFGEALTWEIVDGPGTLTSDGTRAVFTPPAELSAPQTTTVAVFSPSGGTWQTTLQTFPPDQGAIPIRRGNGPNDFRFAPLDQAIVDFMRARCVGSAVVAVSRYGSELYRAGYGRRDGAAVEDEQWIARCPRDDFKPGNYTTHPSTPYYIGSNNKAITAAMAWEAARRRYEDAHGAQPSEAQLAALQVCDESYDLLPARLRDVLCGDEPLLVPPYNAADPALPLGFGYPQAFATCADAPCNNGGTCVPVFAGYSGPVQLFQPVCACPAGFSGGTCKLCPAITQTPPRFDARFQSVTLGQLVSHRAGLPRGGADDAAHMEAIATLRDLSSEADYEAQEDAVGPSGTAKSNLQTTRNVSGASGDEAFFVPQPTDLEYALVNAGTCLERAPGGYGYSNFGYQLLQILVVHVYGKQYSAEQGDPGAHIGSALQEFLLAELGLLSGEVTPFGVYAGQQVPALIEPEELVYRYFRNNTYYPLDYDIKRPDCVWNGSSCSFDQWLGGPRFNAAMTPANAGLSARVLTHHAGTGRGPGIGGLVVEHPIWLRFMRKFWISGDAAPFYGQRRGNNWTLDRTHFGSRPSAMYSYQQQLGTGTLSYSIPPLDGDDRIQLDADQDDLVAMSCNKPDGVDIIVTVNQARDEVCVAEEGEDDPGYTCDDAYARLSGYVAHGLCGVQWNFVQADPFGVVQPEPPDPCALQGDISPGCIAIGN